MLSAGLLGGPGIGYKQDYFATQYLQEQHPALYEVYKAPSERGFLMFPRITGLDGAKVGAVLEASSGLPRLVENEYKGALIRASAHGGQMALKWTALVPLMMTLGFLGLIVYFRSRGGYSAVSINNDGSGLSTR